MKPQSMIALFFVACATEDPYANWDDTAGGGSWGGGAADADADGTDPTADSCSWVGGDVCVEPNEPDNQRWCTGLSGDYSADACPAGAEGTCALPAGGDYTRSAMSYYYNGFDGEGACYGSGGTYTAP